MAPFFSRIAVVLAAMFLYSNVRADFLKYVPVTVSGYTGGSVSGFPALVKIDETRVPGFYSAVQHSGADLKFTDKTGDVIFPYEIDTWNPSGVSYIWVRLPTFSSTTEFRMYYGDASKTVNDSASEVWSDYNLVCHLNGSVTDSSPNNVKGMLNTVQAQSVAAVIGTGYSNGTKLKGPVFGNYIYPGHGTQNEEVPNGVFTVSCWLRCVGDPQPNGTIFSVPSGMKCYCAYAKPSEQINITTGNGSIAATKSGYSLAADTWTKLDIVFNDAALSCYVNGVLWSSGSASGKAKIGYHPWVAWGGSAYASNDKQSISFTTTDDAPAIGFDECRIYGGMANADRVAADYAVVSRDDIFTFGSPKSGLDTHKNREYAISATEKVAVFCEPGEYTWMAPANPLSARLLVVGGGGAGGGTSGGGGGGGEVIHQSSMSIDAGKVYSITVAAGGTGVKNGSGNNGGTSSISAPGFTTVTAIGGGGGGGGWSPCNGKDGANGGGSAGNGNQASSTRSGGQPTAVGGHKGADSFAANWTYGGGGGMAEDGHVYNADPGPGWGGAGLVYDITDEDVMYGYGGGAARNTTTAPAHSGADNDWGLGSTTKSNDCTPGEVGTGGGGGGGRNGDGSAVGAAGGSGTVIIRYSYFTAPTGNVWIEKISDAHEAGLVSGVFRVHCAEALRDYGVAVRYTVSGTAVPGENYEKLFGAILIPVGSVTADLLVTPILDKVIDHDTTVTVTLVEDPAYTITGTGTATLTVIEEPPNTRYVSTTGSDTNDGLTESTAFLTLGRALADLSNDAGGVIYVAPGTYSTTSCTKSAVTATDADGLWYSNYQIVDPVRIIGMGANPDAVVFQWVKSTNPSGVDTRLFYLNHPAARLRNLTLKDGHAGVPNGPARRGECGGGNLFVDTAGGTVEDCVISGGIMETWGIGGSNAYMYGGRLVRCRLTGGHQGSQYSKYSPDTGYSIGAVYMSGSAVVENCLIADSGTIYTGSAVMMRGNSKLLNCTVAGNIGYQCAGVVVQSATCEVRNCAIFGNSCDSDATGYGHVFAGKIGSTTAAETLGERFFNCAADAMINEDCINSSSAGFIDQVGRNYHLGTSSCCRDAAKDYAGSGALSETDLDRKSRKSGASEDIGCYEYDVNQFSVDFYSNVQEGLVGTATGGFNVQFTAVVDGTYTGPLTYEWDFNDDSVVEKSVTANTVNYTYNNCGDDGWFSVRLTVRDSASHVAVAYKTDYIHVGPSDIYTDPASTGGEFPYDTPAKAAPNLFTALKPALDGATVHMAAGDYVWNGSNRPDVNVGVRIIGGTDDPKDTVIRYNKASVQANALLIKVNHPDAFVANITFKDGFVYNGGSLMLAAGVWISGNGGTVSNCVITGCSSSQTSASLQTAGVRMDNGLLTHCILDDNRMYHTGTPLGDGSLNSRMTQGLAAYGPAQIENCLFRNMNTDGCLIILGNNSKSEAPVMRNCTIVDCSVNFWTDNPGSNPHRMQWPCHAIECINGKDKVYNTAICNVRRRPWHHNNSDTDKPEDLYAHFSRNSRYPNYDASITSADLNTDARCCYRCATDGDEKINTDCLLFARTDFVDYNNHDFTPKLGGAINDTGLSIPGWNKYTDLLGNRRVVGKRIDIGCYEQQDGGGLVDDIYVDCLYTGVSDGSCDAPYKTIQEGCAAAEQAGAHVYVRGGPGRDYVMSTAADSAVILSDEISLVGCDAEWNPATGYGDPTNSMANLVIADDYANQSYIAAGNKTTWAAPITIRGSMCTVSGIRSEFGNASFKQQNKGGTGLFRMEGDGFTLENCWFRMKVSFGAYAGAGTEGIVSSAAKRDFTCRRCYVWLGKYRAGMNLMYYCNDGARVENCFFENLDTLYSGNGNDIKYGKYYIISNIFLNCANGLDQTYKGQLLGSAATYCPWGGEVAYNRVIHNNGIPGIYEFIQEGKNYGGSWCDPDTSIHHNTIVGYEIAFRSMYYTGGAMWQPKIFDNIVVDTKTNISESCGAQWQSGGITYTSSFQPGSMFRNNALLVDEFVGGPATLNPWYDLSPQLAGTNTTMYLEAMPPFINTTDPTSENYYKLKVPQATWVINAYTGDDPTFPEFPRYVGAVAPQPGGFAVRIR